MSNGFATRLKRLRTARSLSVKELEVLTSIPYSELIRLENGSGQPSPDLVRRLADFYHTSSDYLLRGEEPSASVLRDGFMRHYDSLGDQERQRLKFAPIQGRVKVVLDYLETAYPDILDRARVAGKLGYPPQALDDVLRDAAPLQSHLLRLLANLVGLSLDFFIRGDFFGGAVPDEHTMDPRRLSAYYQVVQEAIAAGVSPGALRKAVQILSIPEHEE